MANARKAKQEMLTKALIDAADTGDVPAITEALRNGAKVNAKDEWELTALGAAAYNDHRDAIKTLLEAGAKINIKNGAEQMTALHWAAHNNLMEAAEILLADGADLTLKDRDGDTPLSLAGWQKHTGLAEFLQSVADDPANRPTPQSVGLDMYKRNAALEAQRSR